MKQNLQLVGTTRIFAKELNGKTVYSTSISSKNIDGTTIENKTDITIIESFMSFYKNKDGLAMPKIVVMKFEKEEQEEINNSQLPF